MVNISGNYARRIKSWVTNWVTAAIVTHTAIAAAHHAKYTDAEAVSAMGAKADDNPLHHDRVVKYTAAEAVAAVAAADNYVKNTGDEITGSIIQDWVSNTPILKHKTGGGGGLIISGGTGPYDGAFLQFYGNNIATGSAKGSGNISINSLSNANPFLGLQLYSAGGWSVLQKFYINYTDMHNRYIKDQKNHAASALSGTKKLVEIDIGGVPYYYEVYPTKA